MGMGCLSLYGEVNSGALTGVALLGGPCPEKQKVASLIPCLGECLGCGFTPQSGCVQEATSGCFSH